jgi:hypothetical protein
VGVADLVIAAVVLAAASWLLYRSVRRAGNCHGCSSGACGRPPEQGGSGLVRLGKHRPPDA